MSATPIIPGKLYRVRGCGFDTHVLAASGFDALLALLPKVLPCADE